MFGKARCPTPFQGHEDPNPSTQMECKHDTLWSVVSQNANSRLLIQAKHEKNAPEPLLSLDSLNPTVASFWLCLMWATSVSLPTLIWSHQQPSCFRGGSATGQTTDTTWAKLTVKALRSRFKESTFKFAWGIVQYSQFRSLSGMISVLTILRAQTRYPGINTLKLQNWGSGCLPNDIHVVGRVPKAAAIWSGVDSVRVFRVAARARVSLGQLQFEAKLLLWRLCLG